MIDETLAIPALRKYFEERRDHNFVVREGFRSRTCVIAQFLNHFNPEQTHRVGPHYFSLVSESDNDIPFKSPVFANIIFAYDKAKDNERPFTGADALRIMEKHNG